MTWDARAKTDIRSTLFDELPLGGGPLKRAKGSGLRRVPEFWRTEPGLWVVFYYGISPKQGWFENWEFPVFWCADSYWWACVDGSIPPHVLIWASRGDAEHDLCLNYDRGEPLLPGRECWPSPDARRRDCGPHPGNGA